MSAKYLSGITTVKRMKLRNTVRKQITTLAGIRRKLLIGKTGKKIKKTTHSLKNSNHFNKISYMFPEIWFPNIGEFLVTYLFHIHRF